VEVIGSFRDESFFYGCWSCFRLGLIAISGIFRKLSEVNGIDWDFSLPQLLIAQWLAANYRLFSIVLSPFSGHSGPFGARWRVGVT
jgi:hypothetical protein